MGYEKQPSGKYKYTPKKKVMFGKDIEKIFKSLSDDVKRNKKK